MKVFWTGACTARKRWAEQALHLPFASAHDLMRVLSPVVLAQALLMPCRAHKLAPGNATGLELVGREIVSAYA